MNGEVTVYPDPAALARAAAAHFIDTAQTAIALNRCFNVALSGGETPLAMHRLLASEESRPQIDWPLVHIFWTDERCFPPDHPDSNYGAVRKELLDHVPVLEDNIHRILGEFDPVVAAESYEQELKEHFKVAWPRFDLILLGLGADGHLASLFPSTVALEEEKHLALAVQHPKTNQWRVTMSLPVINAAANVTFLVSGAAKHEALQALQHASPNDLTQPASFVRPTSGSLRWMVDRAATGNS